MNTYETTATVEEHGGIRLAGVPFEPGTEVEVSISPKVQAAHGMTPADEQAWETVRNRMREVLGATKGFRNAPRIPREELYERGRVP